MKVVIVNEVVLNSVDIGIIVRINYVIVMSGGELMFIFLVFKLSVLI